MADAKISQLPVGTLTPESIFPIVAEGVTSQITFADIQDAIGTGSSVTKLIVPIGDFLVFKIATGNPEVLEVGDMVQGIIDNKKIEAIYSGGSITALTSFDIINYIDLVSVSNLTLSFSNIDNTMANLGIDDKNSINDWNAFFSARTMSFDSVEIAGNSALFTKNGYIDTMNFYGMEITEIELEAFDDLVYLTLDNNQLTEFNPSLPLPDSLISLSINQNQIKVFNPTLPLPNLNSLSLGDNELTEFDPSIALPSTLTNLTLGNNQLTEFNPSLALPNSIQSLTLVYNELTNFDPSIALPSSLIALELTGNNINDFNPSLALPNSLMLLYLSDNGIINFDPSIALPSSLTGLELSQNDINIFNPTNNALPTTITGINLNYNPLQYFNPTSPLPSLTALNLINTHINTSGWNDETDYISNLPNNGVINSTNSSETIIGTTTESLLQAKGWTINS